MKKQLLIIFTLFFIQSSIFSQEINLSSFFNEKEIDRVKKGEIITRMYLKNNAVGENTDLSINVPSTKFANENFSVYEMITDEKAFIPYRLNDDSKKLSFYNLLLAFSKLKGAAYYSRRVGEVKNLIVDCYRIDSPDKDKKTSDLVVSKIEEKTIGYFVQKDNIFGKMIFRSELFNQGDNFVLVNTSLLPISKFVFHICNKEENKYITYFIYDKASEGFFYYTVNVTRIRMESMLQKGNHLTLYPTTFSNRLRAVTVHLAKILGLNWSSKLNPWDDDMLEAGKYRNYK